MPTALALAAILALALLARGAGLDENPPGFFLDESALAYNAWLVAESGIDQYGERYPLFFRALDDYKEPLYVYALAAWLKAFPPSPANARWPAAIVGVLGVAVAFALGREALGSGEGGLYGALLLAVTPWHVQYSRWSEQALALTVVHSAAVLFLVRALRGGRRRDAAAGGVLLAGGLYAYSTARLLVPLTLAGFLGYTLLRRRERAGTARLTALCFGLAALPFVWSAAALGVEMNLRAAALGLSPLEVLRAALAHLSPQFLFGAGDSNLRHTPGAGLLPAYQGGLLLLGAAAAARARSAAGLGLLLLALLGPLCGAFSREYPHATRALPLMPYAQLTAAGGALALLRLLEGRARRLGGAALLLLVGGAFAGFWQRYWSDYPGRSASAWRYDTVRALDFAAARALPGETVWAPTAHYADWLFVARVPAAEILRHRSGLGAGRQAYDPFDTAGKYGFLDARARLGRRAIDAAQRLELRPGLWVLPLPVLPPALAPRCLYRSAHSCVLRVRAAAGPEGPAPPPPPG